MNIERRQFLGLLAAGYWTWGRIEAALAAEKLMQPMGSTQAKRAVLIGINQYGKEALLGAVTDVELQRQLLIYRFGFAPEDVIVLTDRDATREAINETISGHLIAPTRPGDTAILHFSGHGTLLGDECALLPFSGEVIPESTLQLWLRAINSPAILCVLDTGFRYPDAPILGNFRVRGRPWNGSTRLSATELSYQGLLSEQIQRPSAGGMVLRAATADRLCADAQWQGFNSGVFTYALTQQLWQMTSRSSLAIVLSSVRDTIERQAFATHEFLHLSELPSYGLSKLLPPDPADAVMVSVSPDGRSGDAWLGGLPLCPLGSYGVGSLLNTPTQLVQVRSHSGLMAKVEVIEGSTLLTPGQALQEQARVLPRSISLVVAMDVGLSRIERIDATSAISNLPHTIGVNAAEQFADCLFGKEENRYGLYSLGRSPIVGSFGEIGESVGAALRRLRPLLESWLAVKLLRLTLNRQSSYVGLQVAVAVQPGKESIPIELLEMATRKVPHHATFRSSQRSLSIGDKLSCTLQNLTDDLLHMRIFCLDARHRLMSPSFFSPPYANDNTIPPQQKRLIPQPFSPVDWLVSPPQGMLEVLIVVSRSPLTATTELLSQTSRQAAAPNGMILLANPLQLAQALLNDLHQGTQEDSWELDLREWVTIGFSYTVV